jgi:hypothetical protein
MGGTWEKQRWEGRKKRHNQVWEEMQEMCRGSGNWTKLCNNGGWGTGGSHQRSQMPRTQEPPRFQQGWHWLQYPTKGRENLSRPYLEVRHSPWFRDGVLQFWPISKILTQNCFCLKEIQGQRVEQRLPHLGIHLIQSTNSETIADAKNCLLTRAWYGYPLRGSARSWPIQMQMLTISHWTDWAQGPQWRS